MNYTILFRTIANIILTALVSVPLGTKAQNMVPNGDFEYYTTCPSNWNEVTNANGWRDYHGGSSDYYNCTNVSFGTPSNIAGFQFAASGTAYIGLVTYLSNVSYAYKEYITRIISALTIGSFYEVSLSVNLANKSAYTSNDLGVWFYDNGPSNTLASVNGNILVTPQVSYVGSGAVTDTTSWVRLVGYFTADSAYDNIVIGGFGTPTTTNPNTTGFGSTPALFNAYYLIDSIVVKRIRHVLINYTGSTKCAGDTIMLPYTTNPAAGYFNTGNVFTAQLSNASGSFASPVNIGTLTSTAAGSINCTIPANTPTGSGYRLRIISTNPADTSFANLTDIPITASPVKPIAASNAVCTGDSLHLTATTTTTGVSWSWSGPASFSSAQQNPHRANLTAAHAGDYIVTATLNGCSTRDTETVVVKPLPVKPTAGSNSAVCPGATLNLTATTTTSGVSWDWTGPNSFTSGSQNPNRTNMSSAEAGNYIVSAILNGCSTKDTETVVVYPVTPKPTAGNNSPLCVSNTLNLTASTVAGATYIWGGPAAFTASTQNPTRTNMQLNMAGKYYVTATANGCVSEADSTTVVVNPAPTINLYANPKDTVCPGGTVTLVALVTGGGSGAGYQWYKNGNPIGGATSANYAATGLNNGDVFYCQFTPGSGTGCNGSINSGNITITVLPFTYPSVAITAAPDTNIWQGLQVTFTATATNCAKPAYQWKRNNSDVGGATSNTWGAATLNDNDQISCIMTCNDACPNPKDAVSNKLTIHVAANAEALGLCGLGVSVYPNPVGNELIIETSLRLPPKPARMNGRSDGEGVVFRIFDVLGREVYRGIITNSKQSVNTSSLVSGTYVLQLTSSTGERAMYKVVKE